MIKPDAGVNTLGLLVPNWPAPENVRALNTTRISLQAKTSHVPVLADYAAFNLALHVGDDPASVLSNRSQLAEYLELNERDIAWLEQVHGTDVIKADLAVQRNDAAPMQADASFTSQTGIACSIMTADCLPVLFCNLPEQDEQQHVAAAHAGWRGLASGILTKTLSRFPRADRVIAWLGPAISQKHFEVGHEVYCAFVEKNPQSSRAFVPANAEAKLPSPTSEAKWLASLTRLAKIELEAAGIKAIYGGEHCTFGEKKLFYSYRRDGEKSGRMASIIFIE